jgi:hypothetical protein
MQTFSQAFEISCSQMLAQANAGDCVVFGSNE